MFNELSVQEKENYTNFINELNAIYKKYNVSLDNAELIDGNKGFVGFVEKNYGTTEIVDNSDVVILSVESD